MTMPDHDPDLARQFANAVSGMSTPVLMCECKCDGGEPHADRLCNAPATEIVAMHRWGFCQEPPESGGVVNTENVDQGGNLTAAMCRRCADHAVAVAHAKINILLRDPARYGVHPECPSCRRHTQRWQDILERRPIA